jgi:hypothetical protein
MEPPGPSSHGQQLSQSVADLIQGGNVAFLCGAGVSVPSGLPAAQPFVQHLITSLVKNSQVSSPLAASIVSRLCKHRLEYVLGILEGTPGAKTSACLQALEGGQPSFLHYAAMQCLISYGERPRVALTTNFESLLEDAAKQLGGGTVITAATFRDLPAVSGVNTLVVKLHGDLRHSSDHDATGLSDTLDRISRRFPAGYEYGLDVLLRGKCLIVVGYSGNDHYDVMPYLFRHSFERLIWVQHDTSMGDDFIRQERPPHVLSYFLRESGDLYVRGNTTALFRTILDQLQLRAPEDSPIYVPGWGAKLDQYVAQLGPRSQLVLGDLLAWEGKLELAISQYRTALSQLAGLATLKDSSRLAEPWGAPIRG